VRVVILVALVLLTVAPSSAPTQPPRRPQIVDPDEAVRSTILGIEDARTLTPDELKTLTDLIRAAPEHRPLAVRALGRIERRDAVPFLVEALHTPGLREEAATALMLVLRANAAQAAPAGDLAAALTALIPVAPPQALVRLPFTRPDQVQQAEARLLAMLKEAKYPYDVFYTRIARPFEALIRLHRKVWSPSEETLDALGRIARGDMPMMTWDMYVPRMNAFAALIVAGAVTAEDVAGAINHLEPELRRVAALALFVGTSKLDAARRTDFIREALADSSPLVRYEGVRAWARHETAAHGCGPLLDARSDTSLHVALAAIDALGERCRDDETATERLAEDARTPPSSPEWHREAHALVALARRDPERAASHLQVFRLHTVWQVRMYAARAAAHMKDLMTLERLAYDEHDNVRDAALPALHALKNDPNDPAILAALRRTDYQLLLTVANLLKGTSPNRPVVSAIVDALKRVTADRKETSRDIRLALIDRIREFSRADDARVFEPYAQDFDPLVAGAAAAAYQALTGKVLVAAPRPLPRPPLPTQEELAARLVARFELETGGAFDVRFNKADAPLAYARFVRLAREKYYDGLTFHRVVPNFVIQGGSPGANEYVGHGPFMRDELGRPHRRGTIGISTRGRDTGDAQIFINLVDNPRLDFEYTMFAGISQEQMEAVVDRIQEGTRILRIRLRQDR